MINERGKELQREGGKSFNGKGKRKGGKSFNV
jgi:hypothetical protein